MLSLLLSLMGCMAVSIFWGEVLLWVVVLTMSVLLVSFDMGLAHTSLFTEVDNLSLVLIMLSFWVVSLAMISSTSIKNYSKLQGGFSLLVSSTLLFLSLSFSFSDFLSFYLSFESCLVPIFFMVLGWGYQPERLEAGVYMIMYTIMGSLPLFYMIMKVKLSAGSGYMHSLVFAKIDGLFFSFFLVMAFLVKFPMYGVHLWLLKAHVEAPVAGSMILAGVLLKLGGYGLIRFMVMVDSAGLLSELAVSFSLWGGAVMSVICLRQSDMKLLVASSSVVHMSICISGLFVFSSVSYFGVVMMMVAHGLCSSGLFYLVNVVYGRTMSRSLLVSKGLLNMMPSMSLWWFLMLAYNMAAPPSLNLLSEVVLIISLVSWDIWVMVSLAFMSFFSAAYSMYMYSLGQHGKFMVSKVSFMGGVVNEYLVIFCHWVPLNILVFSLYVFM